MGTYTLPVLRINMTLLQGTINLIGEIPVRDITIPIKQLHIAIGIGFDICNDFGSDAAPTYQTLMLAAGMVNV